ncbi:YxeA family protein [Oceanobacillus sp. CFH 90083]|uniref:YxeA family protein n=1 Tax=Oceanobacillus sp. CFH 90083 TaxID=2592336 RepID=UPI00128C5E70|nr:YxeA family protein [Oceanobacillus sp. CFH 90083]
MKKVTIMMLSVVLLFVAAIVVLATVDFNRAGKDHVYVEIDEPAYTEEDRLDTGEVMTTYWYEQPAYTEDGEEIEVTFSAQKELRQGAYLMLYVNKDNEVSSYDEVAEEELPAAVEEVL